jgi:hypothetical protein
VHLEPPSLHEILVFCRASGYIAAIDVSNPKSARIDTYSQVGESPYYGEGTGSYFFVGNTGESSISELDISNIHKVHLLANIACNDSPLIVKVVPWPDHPEKTLLLCTCQGIWSDDPDAASSGSFLIYDITDATSPKKIGELDGLPFGAGGLETPVAPNNHSAFSVNSPSGSITQVDFSDPYHIDLVATLYTTGGEPHYIKIFDNNDYAVASDRVQGCFWFFKNPTQQ